MCNFCDAFNFDEQWCRTSRLFLARCLADGVPNIGWAGWVGSDEKRIDSRSGHCRVGEIRLEELCLDVLDELIKVSVWVEAELG